jgi:hypothetical protein
MPRHSLPKADLLNYALEDALTRRGVMPGNLTEEEEDLLDADIRELERRIKLVESKNLKGHQSCVPKVL